MDSHLDPLKSTDVQRVLSFARARELYPALKRDDLRECCQAAWVAASAEGDGADLPQRFDRALVLVVWARRGSRSRMPLTDLVDHTIPRIVLEPYLSRVTAPAEPVEAPAPARAQSPERTDAPGSPRHARRIPFASPVPAGAAVAAGVVGVAMLSATEGLPVTPLSPASDEVEGGERPDRPAAPRESAAAGPAPEPAPLAPAVGWNGLADAGETSREAAPAAEAVERAAVGDARPSAGYRGPRSVSAAPAPEPEGAAPVSPPAPEPLVVTPPEPSPSPISVTGTGPAPAAPIQVRRPEPPVVVQVTAPIEREDDPREPVEEVGDQLAERAEELDQALPGPPPVDETAPAPLPEPVPSVAELPVEAPVPPVVEPPVAEPAVEAAPVPPVVDPPVEPAPVPPVAESPAEPQPVPPAAPAP